MSEILIAFLILNIISMLIQFRFKNYEIGIANGYVVGLLIWIIFFI